MTAGQLLALLFTVGWIPLFVYRVESVPTAFATYRPSERVAVAVTPVVISLHMTGACILLSLSQVAAWRAGLGAMVFAGALIFWLWGRGQIGPLRVRRLPDEPPLRLQRNGAFGVVRHPLYFAMLVAAGAPLLVVARPWVLVSFAAVVLCIATRALQEEARLLAQLGSAYEAYSREVKRLIPFVW